MVSLLYPCICFDMAEGDGGGGSDTGGSDTGGGSGSGIDWSMFSEKVKKGSDEPISQAGLNFDTEVSKKIDDDFYMVKSTVPAVWMIDTKSFLKNMRVKKGEGVHLPVKKTELFKKIDDIDKKLKSY